MVQYYPTDQKDDVPPIEEQYYVGSHEVGHNRGNAPDNVNGRLPLESRDLEAIGAKPEDTVWITARANGQETSTDSPRKIYKAGDGVTLATPERRELDLSPGDSIKYWVFPAEIATKNEAEPEESSEPSRAIDRQESLYDSAGEAVDGEVADGGVNMASGSGGSLGETDSPDDTAGTNDIDDVADSNAGEMLVWVIDENPRTYHKVRPDGRGETSCGIKYRSHDHELIEEPGHLAECEKCAYRPSEDLTLTELVQSIGDKFNYEFDDSTRGNYLPKDLLVEIRDELYSENND